jgi:hypothetical protein
MERGEAIGLGRAGAVETYLRDKLTTSLSRNFAIGAGQETYRQSAVDHAQSIGMKPDKINRARKIAEPNITDDGSPDNG